VRDVPRTSFLREKVLDEKEEEEIIVAVFRKKNAIHVRLMYVRASKRYPALPSATFFYTRN
jgi:hypothetical protein